jgi:hypothetical protein
MHRNNGVMAIGFLEVLHQAYEGLPVGFHVARLEGRHYFLGHP